MPQANDQKAVVHCGWDDVPHLSPSVRADLDKTLVSLQPHQREARTKGFPSIGSGAVYPINIDELLVDPHPLPAWWPRAYALDVGWERTAAIWGALDRECDTITLYSEHYRSEALPIVHAAAIRARGDWVPGLVDPAARGRGQDDGKRLMTQYMEEPCRLNLTMANNAKESGIMRVLEYVSQGRLRVFRTLAHFIGEYRVYQRNERGEVIKKRDHLMDATRYLLGSIHTVAEIPPQKRPHIQAFQGDPAIGF